MRIIRSILWIVLLAALLVFTANNWRPVEVKVWEGLILETKIPALVIGALIIGLVPMWLLHRGRVWRLQRRIGALESAARSAAATLAHADPAPVQPPAEPEPATEASATQATDPATDKDNP